jgi:hypothetical protein
MWIQVLFSFCNLSGPVLLAVKWEQHLSSLKVVVNIVGKLFDTKSGTQ